MDIRQAKQRQRGRADAFTDLGAEGGFKPWVEPKVANTLGNLRFMFECFIRHRSFDHHVAPYLRLAMRMSANEMMRDDVGVCLRENDDTYRGWPLVFGNNISLAHLHTHWFTRLHRELISKIICYAMFYV